MLQGDPKDPEIDPIEENPALISKRRVEVAGLNKLSTEADAEDFVAVKETCRQRFGHFVRSQLLNIFTVIAIALGIVLGNVWVRECTLEKIKCSEREISYVEYPGNLILNMYKCLVIPYIAASLISATASLDGDLAKKIGITGLLFGIALNYGTAVLSVAVGLLLRPGYRSKNLAIFNISTSNLYDSGDHRLFEDILLDVFRALLPNNYIRAMLQVVHTVLIPPAGEPPSVDPNVRKNYTISRRYIPLTNQLGLTLICVCIGLALGRIGTNSYPIVVFCRSLSKLMVKILDAVSIISPIMVTSLLVAAIARGGISVADTFTQLGWYLLTVLVTSNIILAILLAAYTIMHRSFPSDFCRAVFPALLTAFGNSSSLATIPTLIDNLDDANLNPRSSRYLVPVSVVNHFGSTIYIGAAAVFTAQLKGSHPLEWSHLFQLSLAVFAGALTVEGVPQGVVVPLSYVLETFSTEGIWANVCATVDWIVDPYAAVFNVLGAAIIAAIVDHWNKHHLRQLGSFDGDLKLNARLIQLNNALEERLETVRENDRGDEDQRIIADRFDLGLEDKEPQTVLDANDKRSTLKYTAKTKRKSGKRKRTIPTAKRRVRRHSTMVGTELLKKLLNDEFLHQVLTSPPSVDQLSAPEDASNGGQRVKSRPKRQSKESRKSRAKMDSNSMRTSLLSASKRQKQALKSRSMKEKLLAKLKSKKKKSAKEPQKQPEPESLVGKDFLWEIDVPTSHHKASRVSTVSSVTN